MARAKGRPDARYRVVRRIVAAIPDELMTFAHQSPVGWRDRYELVWRFQADHTELDILVRDPSGRPARP